MSARASAVLCGSLLLAACSGVGPPAGPERRETLAPCPSSPNCVSTRAADPAHRIDPLEYKAPGAASVEAARAATMDALVRVVEQTRRTRIVRRTDTYLHAEYRTRLGFVDDVEFLLDDGARRVDFRSASRVGYSDLGVNRRRMERFRELYRAVR